MCINKHTAHTTAMSDILQAFNTHFFDFVADIESVFPEDLDIVTAKNALLAVRKANPRFILKVWKSAIVGKYREQIMASDIGFFIDKDYSSDVSSAESGGKIMECIDRLRTPIRNMGLENQSKTMEYIRNLTILSDMC